MRGTGDLVLKDTRVTENISHRETKFNHYFAKCFVYEDQGRSNDKTYSLLALEDYGILVVTFLW